MANIFAKQKVQQLSQREQLTNKYMGARHNLLLVVIFTAVNIGLLVAQSNSYFLFSASIPYYLVDLGMYLCGKYPMEYYADLGAVECIVSLTKTKEDRIKLFENYATVWCSMETDDLVINLIAYDEHSPEIIRVNAVLSSIDEFYETYDVREGDGMYIAPEKRISRWY